MITLASYLPDTVLYAELKAMAERVDDLEAEIERLKNPPRRHANRPVRSAEPEQVSDRPPEHRVR